MHSATLMPSSRILRHLSFLENIQGDLQLIRTAEKPQVSFLVECCHNVSKIALTRTEYGRLLRFVPIIRKIGKCRDANRARSLLANLGKYFLPILVPAIIKHAVQQEVPPSSSDDDSES